VRQRAGPQAIKPNKEKTMSVALNRTCVALALVLGPGLALADGPTDIFPKIDACIEAALQQQEGRLVGWKIESIKEPVALTIDVLAPDDKVWSMKCADGKISASDRKMGNKNYKMLISRTKVPELSARFTAAGSYPIAELRKLEYGLSWKGKPYYTYEMRLNDGRDASTDVNGETGQIDRSKSERKD
jgi:uncharacterized membrane protein YkoI